MFALDKANKLTEPYGTFQCRRYRDAIFRRHEPIALQLAHAYVRICEQTSHVDANITLRKCNQSLVVTEFRLSATMDDAGITDVSRALAKKCGCLFARTSAGNEFEKAAKALQKVVEKNGIKWPIDIPATVTDEARRVAIAGAVARAQCERWWRQQLRKQCGKKVDALLRSLGSVGQKKAPYISNWGYRRWIAAQNRNKNTLCNLEAVRDDGEVLVLADCVAASVANPVNRRNELMTRISGWETIAKEMGFTGQFLTLTCPSAYHARLSKSGDLNPKYNGTSPANAQDYLGKVWSRIRAAWNRENIKTFGFRVCEPHHDGTPHYHFLLFLPKKQTETAWQIFKSYAIQEDGNEPGAEKYRVDRVEILPEKGSAAGYIAKYVAKNIDGAHFTAEELDEESGLVANEGAGRARAWASVWDIRQFQQIGSCSVTVWRELRRLDSPVINMSQKSVETLRKAADSGDWALFVKLMGGATTRRDELTLRAMHVLKEKPGYYGDKIRQILGVAMRNSLDVITTRFHTWEIRPKWARPGFGFKAGVSPPLEFCQ